jgi:Zn-dependent protease
MSAVTMLPGTNLDNIRVASRRPQRLAVPVGGVKASRPECWLCGLMATLALFGSVLLHELSHAITGRRFGLAVAGITLHALGGVTHFEREPDSPRITVAGERQDAALGLALA